ncbi:MAG: ribbon-helix-helix domain-containing protein [Solirubrobacteraceae bacterium MAG38_C4-C5]|nr:ribbon-helix-helix domain-containing protein [Candidatus Siliceabacter maunaloa]
MRRKQLYLDDEAERGLKRLAARTGRSEAAHVRAALHEYLSRHLPVTAEDDPLEDMVGLVDDEEGPDDVAAHHDHYLYGAPRARACGRSTSTPGPS